MSGEDKPGKSVSHRQVFSEGGNELGFFFFTSIGILKLHGKFRNLVFLNFIFVLAFSKTKQTHSVK